MNKLIGNVLYPGWLKTVSTSLEFYCKIYTCQELRIKNQVSRINNKRSGIKTQVSRHKYKDAGFDSLISEFKSHSSLLNTILILLLFVVPLNVLAQKDTLGNEQVNVIKPYQPTLSDAYKISEVPEKDTLTPSSPAFDYPVNPKRFVSSFDVTPIKAIKRIEESSVVNGKNYLKTGFGNYLTTYFEGMGTLADQKNYFAGIHLKHLSSQGHLKNKGYSGVSNNAVSVFGSELFQKSSLHGNVDLTRDVIHFYGFSPDTSQVPHAENNIRQRFGNMNAKVRWVSNKTDAGLMKYNAGLEVNTLRELKSDYFVQNHGITENNFIADADASVPIGKFIYGFKTLVDYNHDKIDSLKNGQAIVTLNPKVTKTGNAWKLTTGTDLTFQPRKNENNQLKLYPRIYSDIHLDVRVYEDIFSLFGEIKGGVVKNNFKNLSDENPFMSSNSNLIYSDNTIELVAGSKGAISKQTVWLLKGSFASVKDMPFFVNTWNYGLNNKFYVIYDDVEVLNFHGELTYRISSDLNLFLKGDYFHYATNISKPWHKPSLEILGSAEYKLGKLSFFKPLEKGEFFVRGDVLFAGTRWAEQIINDPVNSFVFVPVKLKSYADCNISVDYRRSEKISFFVNLNNIGFSQYQRWLNYPVQKLNVLGGLTYSF